MTLRVTPEEALVIAAAGGRCAAETQPADRALAWQKLVDFAAWHRMLPLLWDHLRTVRSDVAAPVGAVTALQELARATTARNVRLLRERDRALEVLAAADIPVIVLKGAALVGTVYAHVGLRPMVDVDLLVPEASIRRAHALIADALGYTTMGTRLERNDDARLAESHHHFPLLSADRAVLIEVHHKIVDDRPAYDVAGIWERAVAAGADTPYMLQAPEDLMLHVGSHYAFDRIHRAEGALGQLGDVVRIAARWELDWDAIAARAREAEVSDRMFLALMSASLLFGDIAPPTVTASLAPESYTPQRGERFVRHRVLRAGPTLPLEQLAEGRRRLVTRSGTLERYVDPDEPTPSLLRLRARRWRSLAHRLVHEAPTPPQLLEDIRLSRWMLRLRR
jgi:hypothetical protein